MADVPKVTLEIDGSTVQVASGTSVAIAVWRSTGACRRSLSGEPRAPLCGMGMCFECRVTIDGRSSERSCLVPCREGMVVTTGGFEADD